MAIVVIGGAVTDARAGAAGGYHTHAALASQSELLENYGKLTAALGRESTDAGVLWDRAENLRLAGRLVEARRLYRQLADGTWQPRFAWVQAQARRELEKP